MLAGQLAQPACAQSDSVHCSIWQICFISAAVVMYLYHVISCVQFMFFMIYLAGRGLLCRLRFECSGCPGNHSRAEEKARSDLVWIWHSRTGRDRWCWEHWLMLCICCSMPALSSDFGIKHLLHVYDVESLNTCESANACCFASRQPWFSLLRCAGVHFIIDVNYFPSYKEFPDAAKALSIVLKTVYLAHNRD